MASQVLFKGSSSGQNAMISAVILVFLLVFPLALVVEVPAEDKAIVRTEQQKPESEIGVGDLYALVVGVSQYAHHPKIRNLNFSDKDAEDFADFLQTQKVLFRRLHITLLLNEKATKEEVEKVLLYELPRAGKDDTVVIFLSGHGAEDPNMPGEFFFLTHDADPRFLATKSVHMNRQWLLSKLQAKRVVLIADACQSGGGVPFEGVRSLGPSLTRIREDFKNSEGKVFITSSRADENSREKAEFGNGVFTHYLLEGLKGKAGVDKDGVVTLLSAYDYVYNKCKDEPGGIQHPQMAGRIVGRFPLAMVRETAPVSFRMNCLYRSGGTGAAKELTNGATLKSGDTYKIIVAPEENLYAYVFQVDTSGQIVQLFPMREFKGRVVNNFNPIKGGITCHIPAPDKSFKLDRNTGKERIYFVAFREPNEKVERLYAELQGAKNQGNPSTIQAAERRLKRYFKKRGPEEIVADRKENVEFDGDLFTVFSQKVKDMCDDCVHCVEFIHE